MTEKRIRKPTEKARLIAQGVGLVRLEIEDDEMDEGYVIANMANVVSETLMQDPRSLKEARLAPDADDWMEALGLEFSCLESRNA